MEGARVKDTEGEITLALDRNRKESAKGECTHGVTVVKQEFQRVPGVWSHPCRKRGERGEHGKYGTD